jgi:hypothetical protein
VVWKKAQVCSERIKYLPVETGQVERAIEADEAFLAAHPMRRKKA